MTPLWRLDIPRDVQIAKWGLGVLMLAFGSAFLYFIGEFKEVRENLSGIQSSISAQSATIDGMDKTLERISDKLDRNDDKPQASDTAKPTG